MKSEAAVQSHVRLAHSDIGPIWRNNSGAYQDEKGQLIRYGLGNDSSALNQYVKSADLIGVTPVTAYLQSAGWCTLGVFTAYEIKRVGWKFNPSNAREVAQKNFLDIVIKNGGFAGFVSDPAEIHSIIRRA